MNLNEWTSVAQIGTAIITLTGVLTSLFMSIKALREVQNDRRLRQAPYLAFESGGFRIPVTFVKAGRRLPGFDPNFVEAVFQDMPEDSESVRVKHQEAKGGLKLFHFGNLINHGMGPAFETCIYWIPLQIRIGMELFEIDDKKREEPRYHKEINRTLPMTRNISPGQNTDLHWLPAFIEKDFEKKIMEASGFLEINCIDIFRTTHTWRQGFYIATGYSESQPYVHVTFGELEEQWKLD